MTVEQLYAEALSLADDAQEVLIERLVTRLEQNIAPEIEQAHLAVVRRRRNELHDGMVTGIDSEAALVQVRDDILQ